MLKAHLITGNVRLDPRELEAQRELAKAQWKVVLEGLAWIGLTLLIGVYLMFYFIFKVVTGTVSDR